jgi:ubiquinone/menaquinone biosynthesis C-methylase UbiE
VAGAWSGPVHSTPLLAALPPGGRVLELGAGGGKVGRALPADALALDWVREGLRHAGARRPRLLADARRLPVRDAALDAVVAIHILGHLVGEDRRAALDEWRRATRPGGALVLEVFARGDARDGQGRAVEEGTWEREGVPTHYFDAAELTGLLRGWEGEVLLDEQERRWGTRRLLRGSFTRSPGDGASR